MSTSRKSRLPSALRNVIDRYRHRWRAIHAETGLFVTLGVVAATVGAAVAADRLLRLSPALRGLALILIGAASLFCLTRWVLWPALTRMGDRDAAARLGHHYPKVEEDLVSAVELSAEGLDERGISQGLLRSALSQIAARAKSVDYRAAVSLRPLRRASGVMLVLVAMLLAAYLLRPEAIRNALVRLFRPSEEFFSYTKLKVEPGDCVVRIGDTVDVVATTWGRQAEVARLYGRKDGGATGVEHGAGDRIFVRLECEDGVGTWHSGPLFKGLTYRVSAGDAISEWHQIRVVPPPSLTNKGAVLRAPGYAGGTLRTIEKLEGPLQIVRGTQVVIRVAPVRRGDDPGFQCTGEMRAGGQSFPLTADASGVLASKPFRPAKTAEYLISLLDGFGLRNRTAEGLFIKVVPDRVPVLSIAKPGRDLLVLPGESIPVAVEAHDEFGLRNLILRTRIIKGKEGGPSTGVRLSSRWHEIPLKDGGPNVAELTAETTLGLDDLGLVAGDVLEYAARASDYAADAILRRGYSPLYRVVVLSEMEHLERILAQLKDFQLQLRRRAAIQKAQAGRAGRLAEKGSDASVQADAREAQQRELEEARATEHLARKLERLIPELTRNPSTPTEMLSQMERLGRGVRSVAREPMQQAADQFGRAAKGQQGKPGQGKPGQPSQGMPSPLRLAQQAADEAARRLEQLAQLAERMARRTILEKLAAEAEALAARQRDIKDNLLPLAVQAVGTDVKELTKDQKGALERIVSLQRSVKDGVDELAKEIEKAAATLAFTNPNDAATAERANEKLDEDNVTQRAGDITRQLQGNVLFSQLSEQESVAESLATVAEILRKGIGFEEMDAIAKELEEFIRRQKEINGHIEGAIKKTEKAKRPAWLGSDQAALQRDVSEQASALHWLAREIELFRSETAGKLDAAAAEMGLGATALYTKALPEGLEHGKKALALLEDAREKFDAERPQMQQAAMSAQMIQAMLLFQRIFLGQKRVNTGTVKADQLRLRDDERFGERAVGLSKKQSRVRVDAKKLQKLIARFRDAAALVGKAADKMTVSRIALGAGDTGSETRQVQRMILALLEKLLGDPRFGAGMGMAGARAQAMMGMMGGGFAGGTNAPILPATLGEAKDERWRRIRSRFGEQLGAAFEGRVPAKYRGLLNAYFDRLRKEPPR